MVKRKRTNNDLQTILYFGRVTFSYSTTRDVTIVSNPVISHE